MIQKVAPIIMLTATGVWALVVLLDAAPGIDYTPSPYIHTIMLGIIGIIGAIYGVRRKNGSSE